MRFTRNRRGVFSGGEKADTAGKTVTGACMICQLVRRS
jgi:hypothetical protein